jgi:hypothetical protein
MKRKKKSMCIGRRHGAIAAVAWDFDILDERHIALECVFIEYQRPVSI